VEIVGVLVLAGLGAMTSVLEGERTKLEEEGWDAYGMVGECSIEDGHDAFRI
jgi:hypothetical protein